MELLLQGSPRLRWTPGPPPTPSYRCGAAVCCVGVAGVFEVLLDAVVDLKEAVVPLRVVGGRTGGLESVPGKRVHGDLCGGQRAEALEAHRRGVAGMRWVCGARRRAGAAPVAVAVAGYPCDGRALEVVSCTRSYSQLSMSVDEHVHSQDAHHLSHDEGKGTKVEGPAVRVAVLL